MPNKQHIVDLSEDERAELESFVSSGVHKAEDITRTRILLKADDGATDAEISRALDCGQLTPYRARKRYADRAIGAIHRRNPGREYERKLSGEDEAHLIALATSEPPDGCANSVEEVDQVSSDIESFYGTPEDLLRISIEENDAQTFHKVWNLGDDDFVRVRPESEIYDLRRRVNKLEKTAGRI